ncbi:TonB-dependent receptor [Croceibacterium sp. TMG7-5b_MA50]|uniref:TonB-dependent receptor n=1 Tax=Croceibacterium sp. TMG7-5b_MA50 TaxID=3121290 RepID=UPI0032218747
MVVSTPAMAQVGTVLPAPPVPPSDLDTPAEADLGTQDNAQQADDVGLGEIVVTAQKREQRLRDVPVAVTALTAEALVNRGISDVASVTRAVPSLTLTQGQNPVNNSINIRGIGTSAFSTGVEPAVAVILDDVALLQQAQAFSGLADIARLEVLRGPQGTLFGKGASAGVVNIATQAPGSELTVSIGGQWSQEDYRVETAMGGPVNDWLGVRANGFYVNRDGYLTNLSDNSKQGNEEAYGARLRADITPTDRLNVSLTASYSRNKNDITRTFRYVAPNLRIFAVQPFFPGNLVAPGIVGVTPGPENRNVRLNADSLSDSRQQMYTGRITLDLGFANLISVTGYQDWKLDVQEDVDMTDLPSIGNNPGGVTQPSQFHARQFSQELRLVSQTSGPLSYVLGLYYSDGDTDRAFRRFAFGPGAQFWDSRAGTESYAAFGQATFDVTPTTHIDGGIRFNREIIDVEFTDRRANATAASCGTTCTGRASDNQVTYKIALRQDVTDDVMAYASYATGYKGQGFDVTSGFNPARANNPVKPETSKAYEIGLKGQFFDNWVQMNLAGFWTDYDNFQTQVANFVGGVPTFNLANAPRLRSRGIEGDISVRPFRPLRIDASASYVDAKIREFGNAGCYPGQPFVVGSTPTEPGVCVGATPATGTQDLAGARLANSPKFKYTIAGTYTVELPALPFDGFLQADWTHQSSVNFDIGGNPRALQEGYGVLNGSVGIESDQFRLSFFVNNLLDKAYVTSIGAAAGSTTDAGVNNTNLGLIQFVPRDARRYVGVRARLNY